MDSMCYVQTQQILLDLFSAIFVQLVTLRKTISMGHVAPNGDRRGAYKALVGKPEGKRPHGRPRRRWEDNIAVDINELGYLTDMDQNRDKLRSLVNAVMNFLDL
jgi:hypothetical protein